MLDESTQGVVTKISASGNDQSMASRGGGGHLVSKNSISGSAAMRARRPLGRQRHLPDTLSDNVFGIFIADDSSANLVERNTVSSTAGAGLERSRHVRHDVHPEHGDRGRR